MKKEKKTEPKETPFRPAPFGALKGLHLEKETVPERKPVPVAAPAMEPDDDLVFLRAMSGVKQLESGKPLVEKPAPRLPTPRKIAEEERQVFLQALEELKLDVTFVDSLPDDVVPLRPIPVNRMRQLRRGTIRIDYELDLHGLAREEALVCLESFIAGAYRRGQKAVLVITGKGNNSPAEPVLLGAVSAWLRDKGKSMVAEFSPAPRQLGGGGAFVVFLKEQITSQP